MLLLLSQSAQHVSGTYTPIIRSWRLYLCYYRIWCGMPCLLVVGGQVQGSRLCVRDKRNCATRHACLSVCPPEWIFKKFDIWVYFVWKSVYEMQVLINSGKNNGYFTWRRRLLRSQKLHPSSGLSPKTSIVNFIIRDVNFHKTDDVRCPTPPSQPYNIKNNLDSKS